jgi:adenylate cyclase
MQDQEFWRELLTEGHRPLVGTRHRLFRRLPGPPRCKSCYIPFGGLGGKLAGLIGYQPSRKNPNICAVCRERLPPGGAEVDIASCSPICAAPRVWASTSIWCFRRRAEQVL